MPELLAHFQLINVNAFLGFGSQQDFKDATRTVAVASQNGLGLPEKDYYFRAGAKDVEIRKEYVQHISNILKLLGASQMQAASEAAAIMKLETALARVSLDITAQRDPHNIYHMMPNKDLQALTPALNWDRLLFRHGIAGVRGDQRRRARVFPGHEPGDCRDGSGDDQGIPALAAGQLDGGIDFAQGAG